MRSLVFSTLFPSQARPGHGVFVENRLRHLLSSQVIEARVVAPVPWFPSSNPRFGEYARYASTPANEVRDGVEVLHPRYLLPPKVGMSLAPLLLALGARHSLRRTIADGFDFDLIDAHYYYPDGIAAAILGRWFDKPVVATARGSDINVLAEYAIPRRWIRWAHKTVAASVFVSDALRRKTQDILGTDARLHVIRNGVDCDAFPLRDRRRCKAELGLNDEVWLVFVGRLTRAKGAHLAVRTIAALPPEINVCFVGDGADVESLRNLARTLGVSDRIRFAGARPQNELPAWYAAASALILPSENEGIPNVVLEALACGTPAVTTAVGGIPEVLTEETAGRMAKPEPKFLAAAVLDVLAADYDPRAVRDLAKRFRWHDTTTMQLNLFDQVVQSKGSPGNA